MSGESWTRARGPRRHLIRWVALLSGLTLLVGSSLAVNAATTTKPYTAAWVTGTGTTSSLGIAAGASSVTLRLTNLASPQSLGSANITAPAGYTLSGSGVVGNVLQLRNLNLAPNASVDTTFSVTAPCLADGSTKAWTLRVKQANDFSGPPGNDFTIQGSVPSTFVTGTSTCRLEFVNQPNTTQTGHTVMSGYGSTDPSVSVRVYDPGTNLTVDTNASVSLVLDHNPSGGILSGGTATAVSGVAAFPSLSVDRAGAYTLKASSTAASNQPISNQFLVADTLDSCSSTTCSFTQQSTQTTFKTTPKKGTVGATYVATVNLSGLNIQCDFAPYNYPANRQPNTVWYQYDDGNSSTKVNTILIDKAWVQQTPENGASAYRVCYAAPTPFVSRAVTGYDLINGSVVQTTNGTGSYAPPDSSSGGPSEFFGTTWYMGLLPDCGSKKVPPAPCVIGWTGDSAGDRIGTFVTPTGDPSIR
jgi:hypothetical protein